jgi:DNA repair protein RecO (recombination protein O)
VRVELQPAYLLHARKISDSRLLLDFLTLDYGTISAVGRVPAKKKSSFTLFSLAYISWLGGKPLKTLTDYELIRNNVGPIKGTALYCGFYANELLERLLQKNESCAPIFAGYQHLLTELSSSAAAEPLLREFEMLLLEELGYAVDFTRDATTGLTIIRDGNYYLDVDAGFTLERRPNCSIFNGEAILALAKRDYSNSLHRMAFKAISRALLRPHLGNKPLKSRELFASFQSIKK